MARTTSSTGLTLDDSDPVDRDIIRRQRQAARESGRSGGDRARTARGRDDLAAAHDEGSAEKAAAPKKGAAAPKGGMAKAKRAAAAVRSTAEAMPSATLRPPRTASLKDAGGFALGLVLQALVVSYIKYGGQGPKGWLKAKFLNKPLQGEDLDPKGPNGEEAYEGRLDPNKPIM